MIPRSYKYIFFRVYQNQRKRIRDPKEAALAAICLLLIPLGILIVLTDSVVSEVFGTASLASRLSKWTYVAIVGGPLFLFHYVGFVYRNRYRDIVLNFQKDNAYGGAGGTGLLTAFFLVPIVVLFIVVAVNRL